MLNLHFTGDIRSCSYSSAPFSDRFQWLKKQHIIGLDTETNVVKSILGRQLRVVSMASEDGEDIWVIQWSALNPLQQQKLLEEIRLKLCVIQNVSFDYTILKKYGCTLENVWDTMLAEQVLTTGLASEQGYHGLQAIYQRRFGITISKDEQKSFDNDIALTDDQIRYAALDVIKLGVLRKLQKAEMYHEDKRVKQKGNKGLLKTIWWENEFAKVVGDMEMNGIRINKDKWYAIEDSIQPIYDKELSYLNDLVKRDFWDILEDNDWISNQDKFVVPIWSSSQKKKIILEATYDFEVEKTAQIELKKLLQDNDPNFPEGLKLSGKAWQQSDYPTTFRDKYAVLKLMILATGQNTESIRENLDKFLLTNLKQLCIDNGWLRPAGVLSLNWSSPVQRLKIFQAINPSIESTGKDILADHEGEHELIPHYLIWGEVEYQLKNFGKKFYDTHADLDGKFRTRYRQVLATGRLSSTSPNILNIPKKGKVYREAVVPDQGYDFLNSDFDGQEMVITAYLSKEPKWLEALENGWDLHSMNAELVYGDEWREAAEPDCAYYKIDPQTKQAQFQKCTCELHIGLRDNVKTVGFGMLYGISEFSLGPRLGITTDEARELMIRFFETCPRVERMMQRFGGFAAENGYIVDPVFGRIRYFDKWNLYKSEEIAGVERAAMNFPIQSAGADLLKISLVLLRRKLNHLHLNKVAQILMPYHDEISAQAKPKVSEDVRLLVENSMKEAGKVAGFPLLGASAAIGDSWYSAH
jgi:DNA polymerase I-like protein with 3'-5' exonuclease and polymerase domains